jgi:hypothetical protein
MKMAVNLTGTKKVTRALAPHLSAEALTDLLATPIERLTVQQLEILNDAVSRAPGSHDPSASIGSLLV